MEDMVGGLIGSVSSFFAGMFANSPKIWGSQYPAFFGQMLLLIIVIDLVIFGWRPLVKKFFPGSYSQVDYVFGQLTNFIWLAILVGFLLYIGGALGEAWGKFVGISTMVWATLGVVALILLGRLATRKSR